MKKIIALLGLIVIVLSLTGCGGGGNESKEHTSSSKGVSYSLLKTGGYYSDLRMQPNGEFFVGPQIDENTAKSGGIVFKVDMNSDGKLEKITAMYGGAPINTLWRDTLNNCYSFSAITIEHQDGYDKYNFKNARMASTKGFYGAHSVRFRVDEKKRHKVAYFYNKQAEQANTLLGFAQMIFSYDDNGNLSKVGYANTNGDRVTTVSKHYETRFKYDKDRNWLPIEVSNYGKDESLMVDSSSIAKTTYKYDDKGRLIEARHFGADESLKEKNMAKFWSIDDKPINFLSAGAITKYIYDSDKYQPKKIAFYGKDEQPIGIKSWDNIASLQFTYTDKGLIASVSSFGTDDLARPLLKDDVGDNVVKVMFEYDTHGNNTGIKFYGKDDTMVVGSKLNAAASKLKYDDKRRLTERAYFGTGDDAIEINKNSYVYHRAVLEYNDDDELIKVVYYNKADQEVGQKTFDSSANTTSPSQNASNNTSNNSGHMTYVSYKNQYHQEISNLASDINAYLGSHANFRNEHTMLSRAEDIRNRIQQTKRDLSSASISNNAIKEKLMALFDAELGRVNGLIDGLRASKNGGSYRQGFDRGGDAFDRFEALDAELGKML